MGPPSTKFDSWGVKVGRNRRRSARTPGDRLVRRVYQSPQSLLAAQARGRRSPRPAQRESPGLWHGALCVRGGFIYARPSYDRPVRLGSRLGARVVVALLAHRPPTPILEHLFVSRKGGRVGQDLNPEQLTAAIHRGGPLLVVAGAGS